MRPSPGTWAYRPRVTLLTAIADRFFDHHVTRREWIGVALAVAGLAFLGVTLQASGTVVQAILRGGLAVP